MLRHSAVSLAYFPKEMSLRCCATPVSLSPPLTTDQMQTHVRDLEDLCLCREYSSLAKEQNPPQRLH